MAHTYNKRTVEERKQEIDTLTDKMKDPLRNYAVNSTDLKYFLRFMDQFREYSIKKPINDSFIVPGSLCGSFF